MSRRPAAVVDWSAFTEPVAPQEVQQWKAAAQSSGVRWAGDGVGRVIVIILVLLPVVGLLAVMGGGILIASIAGLASGDPGGVAFGALGVVGGLVVLALVAFLAWAVIRTAPRESRWERWLRLDRFARENRMTFSPADPDPAYAGAIFQYGGSRMAIDHFRSVEGRFFDFGNFQYVVSNGKSSTTVTWGFLAMNLERRLPHMLLDSLQNNTLLSGLSGLFARDQVLSLEGDFDRYFTLYCPREYETDALYVFTPDLMALCIDEVAPFDVEIVDDWLFVYSPRAFTMENPQLLARLLRIIEVVGNKALKRTHRYRDERAAVPFPVNVVAPPGQRLRKRFPTGVIIALAIGFGAPLLIMTIVFFTVLASTLSSVSGG